jgi:hypothetical protein
MKDWRLALEASAVLRQWLADHERIVGTRPDRDPDDAQGAMIAHVPNARRSIPAAPDASWGMRA